MSVLTPFLLINTPTCKNSQAWTPGLVTLVVPCLVLSGFSVAGEPREVAEHYFDVDFDIDVREPPPVPIFEPVVREDPIPQAIRDAGEQLRHINGLSSGRKGGKGFEPVIRGQQQGQLNVLLGEAHVAGACPGRMDPPTGYASAGYDRVRVIKGYDSVLNGPGGSGGTLLFERDDPDFQGRSYTGRMGGDVQSNSHSKGALADVALGSEAGYVRFYGDYRDVGNYRDGDGHTVSSAFRSLNGGVLLVGDVSEFTHMEANLELTRDRDILYAGSGMDAPLADASIWRFKVQHEASMGGLDEQVLNLYFSDVNHQMDDYTVRLRKPGNPNGMRTPSDSKVVGGRWVGTVFLEQAEWHTGFDARGSWQNADRFQVNRATQAQTMKSAVWPGVELRQWGLFSELDYQFSPVDRIRVGGRYDDLDATVSKAHVSALGNDSPDALYKKYYGSDALSAREHNVSALISWQHALGDAIFRNRQYLEFRGSRSVRSADATERYIASRGSCCHGSDDWVGNPQIKPEQHYQLDAGYHFHPGGHNGAQLSAIVYLDEVSDYIIRYHSTSRALLYRNTGARIYGSDLEAQYPLGRFKPSGSLSWTRGVNRDPSGPDDENLPQIPALLARFALEYESDSWRLGGRCELAASQDKVNLDSGQDQGGSPGFDVWHLYGAWQLTPEIRLQGGVDNLFDRTYAWHVSRGNVDPLNPDAARVNEPGRLFWLGVGVMF